MTCLLSLGSTIKALVEITIPVRMIIFKIDLFQLLLKKCEMAMFRISSKDFEIDDVIQVVLCGYNH